MSLRPAWAINTLSQNKPSIQSTSQQTQQLCVLLYAGQGERRCSKFTGLVLLTFVPYNVLDYFVLLPRLALTHDSHPASTF